MQVLLGQDYLFTGGWKEAKRLAVSIVENYGEVQCVAKTRQVHFSAGSH
jgi:hypothetical protein